MSATDFLDRFLDSNVLGYLFHETDERKQEIAADLVRRAAGRDSKAR